MAFIKAISTFAPEESLTNAQLQQEFPEVDIDKIAKGVGVSQRYAAPEGKTASDMAFDAAQKMFSEWDIDPKSIDFIIFATQSPDYFLPATACILQNRLGIPTTAGAFDFDLGCSGYAYGLAMAKSFVDSGFATNVLLLTGDTISKYLHREDKNRMLFGDSASASLISKDGFAEIGLSVYGTDGSGFDSIIVKNGASRHFGLTGHEELDNQDNLRRDDHFYMNGEQVFNFTIDRVPKLIDDTLQKNGFGKDEIDHFVFHQANKFMLNTIRKVCGIAKDKFYINLENIGNTTSSSIPNGLKDCLDRGIIQKGEKVMIAGFGVGLSWSATVLKF
ncbi:MAG: ketoacyl-ACP synthase III [Bacteroidales bacterium]|nr:ketoacyl-ACP synthase III [Bacteroidales bacterium]